MLELINKYYDDEKSGFVFVLLAGVIFLLLGTLLWLKFCTSDPLSKGFGIGLVIVGIVLIIASFSTRYYNDKKIENIATRKDESEIQLQQSEIQRMNKVMNITYRYAFITFATLIIGLTISVVISKSYYWKGLAIAFILLALFVLIVDIYSSKRNREYLNTVKNLKL